VNAIRDAGRALNIADQATGDVMRHFASKRCSQYRREPRAAWGFGVFANCVKTSTFNGAGRRGGDCATQGVSGHFLQQQTMILDAKKPLIERLKSMLVVR